jgi:pimeloyl-ACP methyl ester carboxylesterase
MPASSKYSADDSRGGTPARLSRRFWIAGISGVAACAASTRAFATVAESDSLEIVDVVVPGFARGFERVRLLVPTERAGASSRTRALILLHGLGETRDPSLALRAWPELYGAISADQRLRMSPVQVSERGRRWWSLEDLSALNEGLRRQPYRGAVLICPRTPNPGISNNRSKLFDDYAAWLCDAVIPAAEREIVGCTRRVGLDGCSLGGYVATEVLLRRPEVFATFGCVQGALGEHRIAGYAENLAQVTHRRCLPLRFGTSTRDPFLDVNRRLSARLHARSVAHQLDVVAGPHDQPWLREIGTLRMLRWHDLSLDVASCDIEPDAPRNSGARDAAETDGR